MVKRMKAAALIATFIGAPLPIKAASEDRPWATWDSWIAHDIVFSSGFCFGVANAVVIIISRDIACLPPEKSPRQHIAPVLKFIDRHRATMRLDHASATSVVGQALVVEHHCLAEEE